MKVCVYRWGNIGWSESTCVGGKVLRTCVGEKEQGTTSRPRNCLWGRNSVRQEVRKCECGGLIDSTYVRVVVQMKKYFCGWDNNGMEWGNTCGEGTATLLILNHQHREILSSYLTALPSPNCLMTVAQLFLTLTIVYSHDSVLRCLCLS